MSYSPIEPFSSYFTDPFRSTFLSTCPETQKSSNSKSNEFMFLYFITIFFDPNFLKWSSSSNEKYLCFIFFSCFQNIFKCIPIKFLESVIMEYNRMF